MVLTTLITHVTKEPPMYKEKNSHKSVQISFMYHLIVGAGRQESFPTHRDTMRRMAKARLNYDLHTRGVS